MSSYRKTFIPFFEVCELLILGAFIAVKNPQILLYGSLVLYVWMAFSSAMKIFPFDYESQNLGPLRDKAEQDVNIWRPITLVAAFMVTTAVVFHQIK